MAFNGSGTYVLPSPEYPAVAGTTIEAADRNVIDADLATALTLCVTRNGQSPPTANLPMGGFKFTGAGDAAARDQFATYGQLQDAEANWADSVGGTADAVTIAITPAITAYEDGQMFYFPVGSDNTGAVTLAVNGLSAIAVEKDDGTGALVALGAGDWQQGTIVAVMMENAKFQWMNKNDRNAVRLTGAQTVAGAKTLSDALVTSAAVTHNAAVTANALVTLAAGGDVTPAAAPATNAIGYLGAPVVDGNSALAIIMTHAGKTIYHDEAGARTWTLPANASIPFPIGTVIIFDNTGNGGAAGALTIAITTDTLRRGDGVAGTGSRTIAASAVAAVRKTKATEWVITGTFS